MSSRCVAFVVAFVLIALPCFAGDPVAAGLKFGLEKSVGKLLERGYQINCKAKNFEMKSDDSWYCGAFASLSGQDKKEWEERVTYNLAKIREELDNIKNGIAEIQRQQETIYNQNSQVLVRLNEIGPETIIGKNVSRIRTIWDDQFTPTFTGQRQFTRDRMIAFANQVIFSDHVDKRLGEINDQLTRSQFGNDTLLRSYAKRMKLQAEGKNDNRLDPAYDYLESVVDGLLADERRGFEMYMWATKTLETECGVNNNCADFKAVPHTEAEYRAVFAKYVEAQLTELNAALEWSVLAASDPHSRNANFLHPDAERLFARADLFTSAQLGGPLGVRGRIISMGDGFDGKFQVGNKVLTPVGAVTEVATSAGPVDWWKSTTSPQAYDEIRFSDRWKVYHYYEPNDLTVQSGAHNTQTSLPYKPLYVTVKGVDEGSVKGLFGSFTAIQRAGGGYAFLSGDWTQLRSAPDPTYSGVWHKGFDDAFFDPKEMRAGIRFSGTLEWKLLHTGKDQHIETIRQDYAVSKKKIRYADGGPLTLRVDFGDTYPALCPGGACADYDHNMLLARLARFKKGPISSRAAEMKTRTAVLLKGNEPGINGLVWEKVDSFESNVTERMQAGKEKGDVTLLKDNSYPIIFGGEVDLNMQTSGADESMWHAIAVAKIDNAYLAAP